MISFLVYNASFLLILKEKYLMYRSVARFKGTKVFISVLTLQWWCGVVVMTVKEHTVKAPKDVHRLQQVYA